MSTIRGQLILVRDEPGHLPELAVIDSKGVEWPVWVGDWLWVELPHGRLAGIVRYFADALVLQHGRSGEVTPLASLTVLRSRCDLLAGLQRQPACDVRVADARELRRCAPGGWWPARRDP